MKERESIDKADYVALGQMRGLVDIFWKQVQGFLACSELNQRFKEAVETADHEARRNLERGTFKNFTLSRKHTDPDDVAFDVAESHLIALRVADMWVRVAARVIPAEELKQLVPGGFTTPQTQDLATRYRLPALARMMV